MLRWYRCEGLGPAEEGTPARGNYAPEVTPLTVQVPTLVIHPDADIYTRPAAHHGLERYVPDLTFHAVEGASHWVAEEHRSWSVSKFGNFAMRTLRASLRSASPKA